MCSRCVAPSAREPQHSSRLVVREALAINLRNLISRSVNGRIGGSSRYADGGRASVSHVNAEATCAPGWAG